MAETLAVEGGEPVRTERMPRPYPGASMIGEEEKRAVMEVLDHRSPFRYYGPDPAYKTAELEETFAKMMGIEHALAVTSGTAALIVAMRALGIGPGHEVIVPAATFVGCAGAVVSCQAVPIFCEVDRDVHIYPEAIEQVITPRTKAISVVHWRGMAADMDPILELGERHGIPVIEDCAQSLGARYKGRYVGSMGTINAFSFQMNKVLSAGEGGMVTTNAPALHTKAVACHDQGTVRGNDDVVVPAFVGENYRMTEMAAAVMLEQLKKLDTLKDHVRGLGKIIKDAAAEYPDVYVRDPEDSERDVGVSVILGFRTGEAFDWVKKALRAEGVPIKHPYGGRAIYMNDMILEKRMWHDSTTPWDPKIYDGEANYGPGLCPKTEDIVTRTGEYQMSMHWTERDAQDVASGLHKVLRAMPARVGRS
ncbi:MAG: DegT/DnrJ/EryC1/StrS family aminotransferase [Candidatus Latescibacteria bacterium]|nr:DegT/DnrJ/EryC1/StrS family aminotransferase [Candidatus Latescibacterota bacterium]